MSGGLSQSIISLLPSPRPLSARMSLTLAPSSSGGSSTDVRSSSKPPIALLLQHRFKTDLQELYELPLPTGLSVISNPTDFRQLCVHIIPQTGHFRDRPLHYHFELPEDWPESPPMITGGHWLKISPHPMPIFWVLRRNSDQAYILQPRHYLPTDSLHAVILKLYEYCSGSESEGRLVPLLRKSGESVSTAFRVLAERSEDELSHLHCDHCGFSGKLHLPLYHSQYSPYEESSQQSSVIASHPSPDDPSVLLLSDLPFDILMEIFGHLDLACLRAMCIAYPRLHDVIVASSSLLARKQIQCQYLRVSPYTPLSIIPSRSASSPPNAFRPILGITANWAYMRVHPYRHLESDCSLLSLEAYNQLQYRRNAVGRKIDFFLALPFGLSLDGFKVDEQGKYIGEHGHYENRLVAKVWKSWGIMGRRVRSVGNTAQAKSKAKLFDEAPCKNYFDKCCKTVDAMSELAVTIIRSFVNSLDEDQSRGAASTSIDDVIRNYWRMHSLLVFLSARTPGILKASSERLSDFIHDRNGNARTKRNTPDLNEFLVLMTVLFHFEAANPSTSTSPMTIWRNQLVKPFMTEWFVRQVHELLRHEPTLEIRLSNEENDFRLSRTFSHLRKGLQMLMFQVRFMKSIIELRSVQGSPAGSASSGRGFVDFPPLDLSRRMYREISKIVQVDDWPAFFDKIGWATSPPHPVRSSAGTGRSQTRPTLSKYEFCNLLRHSIILSGRLRYHRPVGFLPRDHKERLEARVLKRSGIKAVVTREALISQRWWVEKEWSLLEEHESSRPSGSWAEGFADSVPSGQSPESPSQLANPTASMFATRLVMPLRQAWLFRAVLRRIAVAAIVAVAVHLHSYPRIRRL